MSRNVKIFSWIAAGLAAATSLCVLLLATLDWNRAKPWFNARISEATGRPFAINGDFSLTWEAPPDQGGWIPWPRLSAQDITLGNPQWVKTSPNLAEIKRLSFSLNPLLLLNHKIQIPELQLEGASVDLERHADGKNNWTLQSSGASSWQLELQRLALMKAELRVVDAIRDADIKMQIDTLEQSTNKQYGITWKANGSFNGQTVTGSGKAGTILSLRDRDVVYPMQAEVHIGKTAISLEGTVSRPLQPETLDMRLKLAGVSMAQLYPISGIVLPETGAYSTEGRLVGSPNAHGGNWTYEKFSGKMGGSDLSGTLHYGGRQPRPLLKGTVLSKQLVFDDLAPLIGADSNANKTLRGAPPVQPADKVLPVEPFKTERLTSIDADVRFSAQKIMRRKQLPIDNLVANVALKDGVVTLAPLNFGIAGGHLVSEMKLDGREKKIKADMKISARGMTLKQLFPTFKPMQASFGEVNGDARLSATGNSIASLLGSSNGEVKAAISQGTISKLLLEEIGLNIGSIILMQLAGDRQVQLQCLATDFAVTNGRMDARAFVVDTDDATLLVDGQVDLAKERLNLTIKPESKGVRVISLRAPIYVSGSFKAPQVNVDKGVLTLKAGGALALAAVAPALTALIPLTNIGPDKDNGCTALLREAQRKPVAPPPGKSYRARAPSKLPAVQ